MLSKDNMLQVVLYLDLNLSEIFSNNMCFCYKFIKFIVIRHYASNHISIESKIFKNLCNKTEVWAYEKLIIIWKRQFDSNHIVPDTVFPRAFTTQDLYFRSIKIDNIYFGGQYVSTHIVPDKTLVTVFEVIDGNLYIIFERTIRVKPYRPLIRKF